MHTLRSTRIDSRRSSARISTHHVGGVSVGDGIDAAAEVVEGVPSLLPERVLLRLVHHPFHFALYVVQILCERCARTAQNQSSTIERWSAL